jgi:hypothetical protein
LEVVVEVVGEDGAFIGVGGMDGSVRYPISVEFVVAQDLRTASIAVDGAGTRLILLAILVAATVVNQAGVGVPRGGPATDPITGRVGTKTAFLSSLPGRTGTP